MVFFVDYKKDYILQKRPIVLATFKRRRDSFAYMCDMTYSYGSIMSSRRDPRNKKLTHSKLRGAERRGGGLGSSTISKNLMSPTPRRKWYLTTGRRAH